MIWLHVVWVAIAAGIFLVAGAWVGLHYAPSPSQTLTSWSIFAVGLILLLIFIVLAIVGVRGEPR